MKRLGLLVFASALLLTTSVFAVSQYVDPAAGYVANDLFGDNYAKSIDVRGGELASWSNDQLKIFDLGSGTSTILGTPTSYFDTGETFNSFVKIDPIDGSYWVGFTHASDTDRIFHVDSAGTWTERAVLAGNYDIDFYGGSVYASNTGLLGGSGLYQLDTSGANLHTTLTTDSALASGGIGIDSTGKLYYGLDGSNFLLNSQLNVWDITTGTASTLLTLTDAVADAHVDGGDNLFMTMNTLNTSTLAAYNGSGYDVLGTGNHPSGDLFWKLAGDEDLSNGGSIYLTDGYYMSVIEFYGEVEAIVPEPSTMALLGFGLAALAAAGLRRR